MDPNRFDDLVRSLTAVPSRRAFLGLSLSGALGALLHLADAEGKKKKRKGKGKGKDKKKCKGNEQKCGKKCIPETHCCTDAKCGDGGICVNRTCTCFTGFRPCNGTCILEGQCCVDSDCGEGGICRDGTCRCLTGFKPCAGICIPASKCCISADCGAGQLCLVNGSCGKICSGSAECGAGCGCSSANTEGQRVCVPNFGDCSSPTCDSTSQCPQGQQCQNITGCPPTRCASLCPA